MITRSCSVARWSVLLVVFLSGCSNNEYPKAVVTGTVMCGDKPAWGGVITFQPVDAPEKTGGKQGNPGGVSRAIVQEDGSFRLRYEARGADAETDGAIIGPHRVTFILPMTEPRKWNAQDDWLPEEEKARLKAEMASEKVYPALSCGIELDVSAVDVVDGNNSFEFRLTGAAQKIESTPFRPPSGSE